MSEKQIDVLAMMDDAAEWMSETTPLGGEAHYEAIRKARAAVAELIERADYLCRTGEGMIAFLAALARVRSS